MPASEIKSRKENRAAFTDSVDSTPTVQHVNMRNVSQSSFEISSKGNNKGHGSNVSPPTTKVFSDLFTRRSASAGDFGHDLTNVANFTELSTSVTSACISTTDLGSSSNMGQAKDGKRPRHFTPASSKAIDDEDEPRREGSRARLFEGEIN